MIANKNQSQSVGEFQTSAYVLQLPVGLYLISLRPTQGLPNEQNLIFPGVHITTAPDTETQNIKFMVAPTMKGQWLNTPEDLIIACVSEDAKIVVTSMRTGGAPAPSIDIEKIKSSNNTKANSNEIRSNNTNIFSVDNTALNSNQPTIQYDPALGLPIEILAHIRHQGDKQFINTPWAGRLGKGMWIESFNVNPLEYLSANDIEYKALTGSGFETPWISNAALCGTKGMSIPIVGFAVRLKQNSRTAELQCEYSAIFYSGTVVGPFKNGKPCRSNISGDPIEGIQIRITKQIPAVANETSQTLTDSLDLSVPIKPTRKQRATSQSSTSPKKPSIKQPSTINEDKSK